MNRALHAPARAGHGRERERQRQRMAGEDLHERATAATGVKHDVDSKAARVDQRRTDGQVQNARALEHQGVIELRTARQRERRVERATRILRQRRCEGSVRIFHLAGPKSVHGRRLVYDRHFDSSSWSRSPVLPNAA
jgi:hypothetical protein